MKSLSALRGIRYAALAFSIGLSLARPAGAQEPAPAQPAQEAPATADPAQPPAKLNIAALLSNPVTANEDFRYLYVRRSWLAGQGGRVDAFEQIADEFGAKGAYFSAIELLWFADKLTSDQTRQAAYQEKSRGWLAQAEEANKLVQEGLQIFASGQRYDAIKKFYDAVKQNPYLEKAHYQIANTHFLIFLQEQTRSETEIPISVREKIFRLSFEQLQYTIAIDPLYYDAFYLLSNIREILADDKEFAAQSQDLTNRAVDYRAMVLPPLEQIETGKRDASLFDDLGKGFETVGILDYAVFAYQAALVHGSTNPETQQRLDNLVRTYFTPPSQ
jgi:hypothetical protein